MAKDTVTLELQGEVTLAKFADAVTRFADLVAELSGESKTSIRWEIDDLEVGSATATAKGMAEDGVPDDVDRVMSAYLEVGRALESGERIPFPERVRQHARDLAAVIGDGVEALRFETAEADALVRAAPVDRPTPQPQELAGAYGAVTGRVQTLTSRSRLRFTLFDTLHDRAVSCYLTEGMEAQARDIWDRVATVEGWVTRDSATGRPMSVRKITKIELVTMATPDGYQRARGVLPHKPGEPLPEERIRRMRDAG